MSNVRDEKAIENQIDLAAKAKDEGGKYFGMSYEEGVQAALEWVTGVTDELPMEED